MGVSGVRAGIVAVLVALAVLVAAGDVGATKGICLTSNCNTFGLIQSGYCSAYTNSLCNLSTSGGAVVWCNTSGGMTCNWYNPIQNNGCQGYCDTNPAVGCQVIWQKCKNPQP
jgi:hypothetical protein